MNRVAAVSSFIFAVLLGSAVWIGIKPDQTPGENWRIVNQEVAEALTELTTEPPKPILPLDLNLATAGQLDTLPGIGPAKAKAIIDYRSSIGRFQSVEQLLEVKGIGPKIFEGLQAAVTIGTPP